MQQIYRLFFFTGKYIFAFFIFIGCFQFNIGFKQLLVYSHYARSGQTEDERLIQDLSRASIAGDIDKVKKAIVQGADINGFTDIYYNGDRRTPLMFVSRRNIDLSSVAKILLEAGANPNLQDEDGQTALMFAAQNNHIDLVNLLLDAGANPLTKNNDGKSVLFYAANAGGIEIIEKLTAKYNIKDSNNYWEKSIISHVAKTDNILQLRKIANPQQYLDYNFGGDDKATPIMYAAYYGSNNAIEAFIELGDDPNKVDKHGNNLLHWATFNSQLETIKLLLKYNLDPLVTNNKGRIPLMHAGNKITEFLFKRNPDTIYIRDNSGKNTLDYALNSQRIKKIRLFESYGIKFTQRQIQQVFLAEAEHIEYRQKPQTADDYRKYLINDNSRLKKYLNAGVDINAKNDKGMTALMIAIFYGLLDRAEFLLEQGADTHLIDDKYKKNAFCHTGSTGNYWGDYGEEYYLRVAKLMIQYGVDLNTCDHLIVAASSDYKKLAQFLIDNGADVNYGISLEKTPLYVAVRRNNFEITKMLLEKGAINERVMWQVTYEGRDAMAKLLIDYGFANRRAILKSIEQNNILLFKYFIDNSENKKLINSVDRYNKTFLMSAALQGKTEIVKFLLENNANPNVSSHIFIEEKLISKNGFTALTNAVKLGREEIVRLLLTNNADPNLPAYQDPLFLAVENNRIKITHMLLDAKANGNKGQKNFKEHLLMDAVSRSQLEIINHLLDYNTDINYLNPGDSQSDISIRHSHFQGTPLMWAIHKKQDEAAKLLIERGADVEKSLKLSREKNLLDIYHKIIELNQSQN